MSFFNTDKQIPTFEQQTMVSALPWALSRMIWACFYFVARMFGKIVFYTGLFFTTGMLIATYLRWMDEDAIACVSQALCAIPSWKLVFIDFFDIVRDTLSVYYNDFMAVSTVVSDSFWTACGLSADMVYYCTKAMWPLFHYLASLTATARTAYAILVAVGSVFGYWYKPRFWPSVALMPSPLVSSVTVAQATGKRRFCGEPQTPSDPAAGYYVEYMVKGALTLVPLVIQACNAYTSLPTCDSVVFDAVGSVESGIFTKGGTMRDMMPVSQSGLPTSLVSFVKSDGQVVGMGVRSRLPANVLITAHHVWDAVLRLIEKDPNSVLIFAPSKPNQKVLVVRKYDVSFDSDTDDITGLELTPSEWARIGATADTPVFPRGTQSVKLFAVNSDHEVCMGVGAIDYRASRHPLVAHTAPTFPGASGTPMYGSPGTFVGIHLRGGGVPQSHNYGTVLSLLLKVLGTVESPPDERQNKFSEGEVDEPQSRLAVKLNGRVRYINASYNENDFRFEQVNGDYVAERKQKSVEADYLPPGSSGGEGDYNVKTGRALPAYTPIVWADEMEQEKGRTKVIGPGLPLVSTLKEGKGEAPPPVVVNQTQKKVTKADLLKKIILMGDQIKNLNFRSPAVVPTTAGANQQAMKTVSMTSSDSTTSPAPTSGRRKRYKKPANRRSGSVPPPTKQQHKKGASKPSTPVVSTSATPSGGAETKDAP